ncbi:MAG: hypothetical protein IKE95_07995 [Methanobrevibacter sp.]|nr:hypothetical protein [Methanobrevibacter sp.]
MTIEVLINKETLMEGLQQKADELPEELKSLTAAAAFAVDKEIKKERPAGPMPVITGNLQGSISIDNISDYEKRIYPNEGIAPYAIYVLKGIRGKGRVDEIDFMGEGFENAQPEIENAVEDFKSWLLG